MTPMKKILFIFFSLLLASQLYAQNFDETDTQTPKKQETKTTKNVNSKNNTGTTTSQKHNTNVNNVKKSGQPSKDDMASCLKIRDVKFGNVLYDGTMVDDFGATLYEGELYYLKPKIVYDGKKAASVTFDIKIKSPDGNLNRGKNSPTGYSYSQTVSVNASSGNTIMLPAWGDKSGNEYESGTHTFEIWCNGRRLYETEFEVKPKYRMVNYDELPNDAGIKASANNRYKIGSKYLSEKNYEEAAK